MHDFHKNLIDKFVAQTRDKEKLLTGLKILKQQGIDPLEPKEPLFMYSYLSSHIFRTLMRSSPTQSEKEFLTKLWNTFKPEGKESLKYYCIDTPFGRGLLASVVEDKSLFETIIAGGILSELKSFIEKKPDFFKNNKDFRIRLHPLRKMLMCEEAGMQIDFKILRSTVSENYKVKVPSKLFNFVKRHKDKVTPDEWDELMVQMLANIHRVNFSSSWKRDQGFIADVFSLVEQINEPKKYKVQETIFLNSYFTNHPGMEFLDNANKGLSADEINARWIKAIVTLNHDTFLESDLLEKFYLQVDKGLIINAIKNSADLMKKAMPFTVSGYPLGDKYAGLFKNEVFKPALMDMVLEHGSRELNLQMYMRQKGKPNTTAKQDLYRYYSEKLLSSPDKKELIQAVMGQDYDDDAFKKIQQVVALEKSIPEKSTKESVKIKI